MPILQSRKKNSINNNNINKYRDRERKKSMRGTTKILIGGWGKLFKSKKKPQKPFLGDSMAKKTNSHPHTSLERLGYTNETYQTISGSPVGRYTPNPLYNSITKVSAHRYQHHNVLNNPPPASPHHPNDTKINPFAKDFGHNIKNIAELRHTRDLVHTIMLPANKQVEQNMRNKTRKASGPPIDPDKEKNRLDLLRNGYEKLQKAKEGIITLPQTNSKEPTIYKLATPEPIYVNKMTIGHHKTQSNIRTNLNLPQRPQPLVPQPVIKSS